jgi:hypothetical protein
MPRRQSDIHVKPAAQFFNYCCAVAHLRIEAGDVPDWFREQFDRGQHIEREYKLPPQVLLIFALALHFSFEMPTTRDLKRFKKRLEAARDLLQRTRTCLLALRDFELMPLGPPLRWHRETAEGLEYEEGPDPTNEIVLAIDTYLKKLMAIKIGRRTSAVPYAVRKVESFVDRHNPALTPVQREQLCHDLFDEARKRRKHRSRSPTRDDEEMPRYRDLLSKRSTRLSRKIGKKAC